MNFNTPQQKIIFGANQGTSDPRYIAWDVGRRQEYLSSRLFRLLSGTGRNL